MDCLWARIWSPILAGLGAVRPWVKMGEVGGMSAENDSGMGPMTSS